MDLFEGRNFSPISFAKLLKIHTRSKSKKWKVNIHVGLDLNNMNHTIIGQPQ
jgi:hypothetical protein